MTVALAAVPDAALGLLLPWVTPSALQPTPGLFIGAVIGLTGLVVVLSYWPIRNLLGRHQLMNYSFNRLHLVNAYGAFGSVSRARYEVVVEGTADEGAAAGWREYEFRGKPVDPGRLPPQVAPYHLRLDWLMWFAALSPAYAEGWFIPFLERLLRGDPATRGLLRRDPFGDAPPRAVRARLYRYRFTTLRERRETGHWWWRELVGEYVPPLRREYQPGTAADRTRG
jgi:hypothetical protein